MTKIKSRGSNLNSASRIDLILLTESIFNLVTESITEILHISDHNLLKITLCSTTITKSFKWHRIGVSNLKDQAFQDYVTKKLNFFSSQDSFSPDK